MSILLRWLAVSFIVINLAGCSNLTGMMFYPLKTLPVTPDRLGLSYQVVEHQASDGTQLVSWWLPANGEAKGTVVFLHGNAQNISYHQLSVSWLTEEGYNVFMLGYRQFGASQGIAKLPNIFLDVHSALDWVVQREAEKPLVLLGQSMGASLAVYGLASYSGQQDVDGLVLDASFHSFPKMAAHAMSSNWITWAFQLPAYSITDEYDPINWINMRQNIPLLMLHSPGDKVVPYEFGEIVYQAAQGDKSWLDSQGPHIASFNYGHIRQGLLAFMQQLQ